MDKDEGQAERVVQERRAAYATAMNAALETMAAEGNGLWAMDWFSAYEVFNALIGVAAGREVDERLLVAFHAVMRNVEQATDHPELPFTCLTCETDYTLHTPPPHAVLLMSGLTTKPSQRIVCVLCEPCNVHEQRRERVMDAVRKFMLPNAKVLYRMGANDAHH